MFCNYICIKNHQVENDTDNNFCDNEDENYYKNNHSTNKL